MIRVLSVVLVMIIVMSAKADVHCEGKSDRGNLVEVTFTERLAMVKSSGSIQHLFFENLEKTWDGHGAGILIGHRDGKMFDKKIIIKYQYHYGNIRNVVIITDTESRQGGDGNYDHIFIPSCSGNIVK